MQASSARGLFGMPLPYGPNSVLCQMAQFAQVLLER